MRKIEVVAVGFDGSPEACAALSWAASLCGSLGASLEVVHAVGLLEEAHLVASVPISEPEIHALARDAGLPADRLDVNRLDGSPADVLLRLTTPPSRIDLLVVGSRGLGQKAGTVLGSTSLEVAERAAVPVVIIPAQA